MHPGSIDAALSTAVNAVIVNFPPAAVTVFDQSAFTWIVIFPSSPAVTSCTSCVPLVSVYSVVPRYAFSDANCPAVSSAVSHTRTVCPAGTMNSAFAVPYWLSPVPEKTSFPPLASFVTFSPVQSAPDASA